MESMKSRKPNQQLRIAWKPHMKSFQRDSQISDSQVLETALDSIGNERPSKRSTFSYKISQKYQTLQ